MLKKRNLKRAAIDPLDNEIELRSFSQYPLVLENDSLKVYEQKELFGCLSVLTLIASALLYFIDKFLLIVFFLNLLVFLIRFIWNYKYSFRKKPVLTVDKTGIQYKNHHYQWEYMTNLVCGQEYDGEREVYTATHVKFNYQNKIEKIYIGGYSRPSEEIIHYISSFQRNQDAFFSANRPLS